MAGPAVMDEQDYAPDWQQQQEAESARYFMTKDALDRCAKAGAKPNDLKLLAGQCGLTNYEPPHVDARTARVG